MEKENVKFALNGIKIEQFAILEENYDPNKIEISLGTGLQFKIDNKNEQIACFLSFEFIQKEKIFLKIQVSCHFKIEKSAWNSFIKEDNLVVSKGLLAHLAMITTGTARGALFAKTEGTPFSKYIVPTINVEEMIKEDALFEIGK